MGFCPGKACPISSQSALSPRDSVVGLTVIVASQDAVFLKQASNWLPYHSLINLTLLGIRPTL